MQDQGAMTTGVGHRIPTFHWKHNTRPPRSLILPPYHPFVLCFFALCFFVVCFLRASPGGERGLYSDGAPGAHRRQCLSGAFSDRSDLLVHEKQRLRLQWLHSPAFVENSVPCKTPTWLSQSAQVLLQPLPTR